MDLARAIKAQLSIIFIGCSNKIRNCVMLSLESNKNGEQNNNWSNEQKDNFAHVTFLYIIFFVVVLHDYNLKLPETS